MYVLIDNKDQTAHVFKDKTAAANFLGLTPFIFSKILDKKEDFGGRYAAYKASTHIIKSSRGGYRPPKNLF